MKEENKNKQQQLQNKSKQKVFKDKIIYFKFRSFQQKRDERVAYLKASTVELKKKLTLKV